MNELLNIFELGGAIMYVLFVSNILMWYFFWDSLFKIQVESNAIKELIKDRPESNSSIKKSVFYPFIKDYEKFMLEGLDKKKALHLLSDKIDLALPVLERKLNLAGTIVQLAPLLGLLGTVSGIIITFDALQYNSLTNELIANGISKALYTTEFGLIVAIPGVYIGLLLSRKVARLRVRFRDWLRESLYEEIV